jgi:hypothetical protein
MSIIYISGILSTKNLHQTMLCTAADTIFYVYFIEKIEYKTPNCTSVSHE